MVNLIEYLNSKLSNTETIIYTNGTNYEYEHLKGYETPVKIKILEVVVTDSKWDGHECLSLPSINVKAIEIATGKEIKFLWSIFN